MTIIFIISFSVAFAIAMILMSDDRKMGTTYFSQYVNTKLVGKITGRIFVGLFIILYFIFSPLISDEKEENKKQEVQFSKYIGKKVVFKKDTLIVGYQLKDDVYKMYYLNSEKTTLMYERQIRRNLIY